MIYEVMDVTDDDSYRSMGVFLDKDEAIKAINDSCQADYPLTDYAEEFEQIEIHEKKIGMNNGSKIVYTLSRKQEISKETGEYIWRTVT